VTHEADSAMMIGYAVPDEDDAVAPTELDIHRVVDELLAEGAGPATKRLKQEQSNPCHMCGAKDRYTPPSGHTGDGWCPMKQAFSMRSSKSRNKEKKGCGEKLRDLNQQPSAIHEDEHAKAFIDAVGALDVNALQLALASKYVGRKLVKEPRPELLLMQVPVRKLSVSTGKPAWTWTVVSEVASNVPAAPGPHDALELRTLDCLLGKAQDLHLELDHPQMCKSDTMTTCMHEAVYRGNAPAIKKLAGYASWLVQERPQLVLTYQGKLSLWAESRSGWLPFHNACIRRSPAYERRDSFLPWLMSMMDDQLSEMRRALTRIDQPSLPQDLPISAAHALSAVRPGGTSPGPKGFHERNSCDVSLLPPAPNEV